MKQFVVDAFSSKPFAGNPAAVCIVDAWPTEDYMMALAAENNLSETAFAMREPQGWHLRWFTPGCEVEICGHATLATAFVIFNHYEPESTLLTFDTMSGKLGVRRDGDLYELDFPTYELREVPVTDAMERAFGVRPVRAVLGLDLVCVFADEADVRTMAPDQKALAELDGRIQNATAAAADPAIDCVSRSFCPKLAIPEDPVCGSAHVQIAQFWARELGRPEVSAYQASKRGGFLRCKIEGGRALIAGPATLVSVADVVA